MLSTSDINSATTMENHTPSIPQILGRTIIAMLWKTKVLKNAISAEVNPSFKAVKNAEVNIPNPEKIKQSANILNP